MLAARRAHLGPSLSVSYRRPLTIVRGWMQHLYDADGRAYLDAVNNVPHVGHCHPRVVEAGQRQMAVLNTNTRYLHERLGRLRRAALRHAARAAARLLLRQLRAARPTNSRCAWRAPPPAAARRIVVEVGYHGNTTTVVDISSVQVRRPGRSRRAAVRAHGPDAGRRTAGVYRGTRLRTSGARVRRARRRRPSSASRRAGARVGAFIAESILSCGGQIVLPPGYLRRRVRRRARPPGGVCIADEVQVGFGRVGPALLGLRDPGRRARHRHDGQADRQRPPAGRRRDDAGRSPTRSPTAWSTSTPSAAIPCRAPSAWPCST